MFHPKLLVIAGHDRSTIAVAREPRARGFARPVVRPLHRYKLSPITNDRRAPGCGLSSEGQTAHAIAFRLAVSVAAAREPSPDTDGSSVQTLIDALSVALARPVLLDDAGMVPLAYSRQWGDLDAVRTNSILSRGASAEVREALVAQGVAEAAGVVRTRAESALGMLERVCVPVRGDGRLHGYIWLLDPEGTITDAEVAKAEATARSVARQLASSSRRVVPDHTFLLEALSSPSVADRERAVAEVHARRLLPDGPLVLCALAARSPDVDTLELARQASRRLSVGHSLAASTYDGAALVVSLLDPVLGTLPGDEVAAWLRMVTRADVATGQSGVAAGLGALHEAARQARIALRGARNRAEGERHAAWTTLGADRLVAQLPDSALADAPAALVEFLRGQAVLAETLAAFLEAAGDVQATAAQLSLHRSGLYYRLRRIEELTGLNLDGGDDRLLAHLALRLHAGTERSS